MVKGCQRRVLHLKNPESGLFEEAFFFLKTPAPPCDGASGAREMVDEANRILLGCRAADTARRPRFRLTAFFLGALAGAAFTATALLVIGLII